MQADPRLRRRRLRGEGVPRGAARVRGRGGDPRGARLPRPGDRLRQDGRAQLRARAAARRAGRDRAAGASSASRARARSAGSSATRPRRPARRAASVGAAVAAYDRGATILRVHDVREHVEALRVAAGGRTRAREDRAARPRALRPPRRARGGARARPALPLRRRARGRRARRERPDRGRGRLPRGRGRRCARSPTAASALLEALATAIADDARSSASSRSACGCASASPRCARPGSTSSSRRSRPSGGR